MMRDWLTKDLGWKIFSVILAVVVWVTVHNIYQGPGAANTRARENTYGDLPVLVVSEASDVHDFHVVPATVSVTVSGPPEAMSTLQANEIRATVDITTGKELRRKVEISTPPNVTLVSVEPSHVSVIVPSPKIKTP
jgi:YbbR domain-containing protein